MTATASHAFVAFRRCGKAMLLAVDDPDTEDNEVLGMMGDEIVSLLRAGGRLDRMPIEESRTIAMCFGCKDCT